MYCACRCFNPRAHVGRDRGNVVGVVAVSLFQSTRPRGARRTLRKIALSRVMFQSTRPRGARPLHPSLTGTIRKFQSTRPRGARHKRGQHDRNQQRVSIHAPTWGATRKPSTPSGKELFQSTRPRGARHELGIEMTQFPEFQSTRPRGARRKSFSSLCSHRSFNPRAHVGRDKNKEKLIKKNHVSIHAPTWGATLYKLGVSIKFWFQSTRPRGARL